MYVMINLPIRIAVSGRLVTFRQDSEHDTLGLSVNLTTHPCQCSPSPTVGCCHAGAGHQQYEG